MGFYSDAWLREARNRITSPPNQPGSSQNLTAQDFDQLADAVEKAIKAALIENHGSIPQQHDHKKLVPICQSTGVWDVLPPALKNLVQEIDSNGDRNGRRKLQYNCGPARETAKVLFDRASTD